MLDDRTRLGALVGADRLALHAVARVGHRALIGAVAEADAFHPDREAGEIHHHEHVLEAAVLLADQPAGRAAVVAVGHHAGRARVDAELVLDRHAVHVVARAEAAVGVDEELGHDEQRYPLDALGRVRRAREHQVNDVVGVVVLAVGDEDLLAEDPVGAVALRHRARAHRRQVRAGLRLGEVHRAGPHAGDHLVQVGLLQRVAAVAFDRLDRALRQQRAQVERHVRRMPHLLDGGGDELRQALAAEFRALGEPVPAVLAELPVRVAETGGRLHRAVVQAPGAFLVARPVQRVQHVGRELRGLVQHRCHDIGGGLIETRQRGDLVEAGQLGHHEMHFGKRRLILAHGGPRRRMKGNGIGNEPGSGREMIAPA